MQKTTLTRKVTYGGKTVVYPIYRVRLDALYYNDQNDRIATWITRYESENGQEALRGLNLEIYNRVIENFIVESNPETFQFIYCFVQVHNGAAELFYGSPEIYNGLFLFCIRF